jgi:16S rRNA (guanine966-N2)-methyltransferase
MRIVGGQFRGRRLEAPKDRSIRPTSDRAREAIFNLLAHHAPKGLDGAAVLDLFCGSGALALEALSRGAASACLVDSNSQSLSLARRNVMALGVEDKTTFLCADATRLGKARQAYDFVFCDAPYGKGLTVPAVEQALAKGWLVPGGLVVIETGADEEMDLPGPFDVLTERTYGAARVILMRSETI